MSQFTYHAHSPDGQLHKGELNANNRHEALRQLRQKGLSPVTLYNNDNALRRIMMMEIGSTQKISRAERAELMEQLALLLDAGLTIEQSLTLLIESLSEQQQPLMQKVLDKLRAGEKLSVGLNDPALSFSAVDINMIRAGELSATLPIVLKRLAEYHKNALALKNQLFSALTYPFILTLTAIGVIILMVTVILPRFEPIFADAGASLPWITRALQSVSHAMINFGPWFLLLLFMTACYVVVLKRDQAGQKKLDDLLLRFSFIRSMLIELATIRFARGLAILLEGGVTLQQALPLAAKSTGNLMIDQALQKAAEDVEQGKPLWQAIDKTALLTPLTIQFLRIGEESNQLTHMLNKLADMLDYKMEKRLKKLTSMLTPMVTLFMGLVVGVVIWSIMSAVLGINQLL